VIVEAVRRLRRVTRVHHRPPVAAVVASTAELAALHDRADWPIDGLRGESVFGAWWATA
jgi:hypothetical protein